MFIPPQRVLQQTTILWCLCLGAAPTLSQEFTLQEATVADINAAFDAGTLNAESLVQLYLSRIEAYDDNGPELNTLITINRSALDQARVLDQERRATGPRSLLHGIPILLKDQVDVVGMPSTAGSIAFKDYFPVRDAFVIQRLRDAGAIILGKTNLDEFGCCSVTRSSLGGETKNPYDVRRVPGGSSGGTAAAVAANFAVMGTGADGWGSIQEPAALNSLVGLLPTHSLVSREGFQPRSFGRRGTTGPIARTVADAAVLLDALAAVNPNDPATLPSAGKIPSSYTDSLRADGLEGARLGYVTNFLSGATRDVRALTNAAIDHMESAGAIITPLEVESPSDLFGTYYDSLEYSLNRYLDDAGANAPFANLQELIQSGQYLPELDLFAFQGLKGDIAPEDDQAYADILTVREAFESQIREIFITHNLDALAFPPLLTTPPTIASTRGTGGIWESESSFRNLNPSPFLGFPSITVPAGFSRLGIPIGIELLGLPFSEPTLIEVAYSFEQSTQHRVPPPVTPPLPGESVPESNAFLLFAVGLVLVRSMRIQMVAGRKSATKSRWAVPTYKKTNPWI